jgi:hypothetical protein
MIDRQSLLPAETDLLRGGVHIRRHGNLTAFMRCPTVFKFRPGHADHLHVSLFDQGQSVADDPGTISYNSPSRLWAGLSSGRFHNVPLVDDRDFMEKATRFLWLPWIVCSLKESSANRIQAEHSGFQGFKVGRELMIEANLLVVRDSLVGSRVADLSVRWHGPSREQLARLSMACSIEGASESWHHCGEDGLGWRADRYGQASPNWCRILRVRARSATFTTTFPISA